MTITAVLGNIKHKPVAPEKKVTTILVENEALAKRIHHVVASDGEEVSIRLPQGGHLHVGDILAENADRVLIVDVLPEEVLVITPKSLYEMGKIAHELGNRHLPAQFTETEMLVQYDYLVERLLTEQGLAFSRQALKLAHPFRHIGHSHHD